MVQALNGSPLDCSSIADQARQRANAVGLGSTQVAVSVSAVGSCSIWPQRHGDEQRGEAMCTGCQWPEAHSVPSVPLEAPGATAHAQSDHTQLFGGLPVRVQLTSPRKERGAVAVTVALLTIPLLILTAFTVDFGMAYAQGQAYSAGADSAALAIVNAKRAPLLVPPAVPPTCDDIRIADAALSAGDPTKASSIALTQVNANTNFGTQLTASDVTTALSCTPAGVLVADVDVKRNVPTSLGARWSVFDQS